MSDGDMDVLGKEAAAFMRLLLQITTLIALRTRQAGQRQAEQRAKTHNRQVELTKSIRRENQELAKTELARNKARDPRNQQLISMTLPKPGVNLEKPKAIEPKARTPEPQAKAPERRPETPAQLAFRLAEMGVSQEVAVARQLHAVAFPVPAQEAIRLRPGETIEQGRARGRGVELSRGLERGITREIR